MDNLISIEQTFDSVNVCLKGAQDALKKKTHEIEIVSARKSELEQKLINSKVETILALNRAKNLAAAKALLDFSRLKLQEDDSVSTLEEQVQNIKRSHSYLFENDDNSTYVLVPVKVSTDCKESLSKSIQDFLDKSQKTINN